MHKVVTPQMMSSLEAAAYKEGWSERDFMEKAGQGIAQTTENFVNTHAIPKNAVVLCGKGNNGGDAFVAGCYLLSQGFSVLAIQLESLDHCSPLCQENGKRFMAKGGHIINKTNGYLEQRGVILDGLFGTGFKGEIGEPYASLIKAANASRNPILAIDIPSGLNGTTGEVSAATIAATETIYLGLPKTGFFLSNGWNTVGKLRYVNFGLPPSIIPTAEAEFELLTPQAMAKLIPPIRRNRHKYQAGYVMGLAGSPEMPGAALLTSLAALRGGSGIVKLLHPAGMESQLAASPYELIKIPYLHSQSHLIAEWMNQAGAAFIGPGMTLTTENRDLLREVMPQLQKPCVIDAGALALLSEDAFELPPRTILTPHTGEMQRLLHQTERLTLNSETLQKCQRYAEEKNVTLILKGAPTFIFAPGTTPLVNPTGDPGMATAGSGDVLTGLLAALLSEGLECREAAALGVYLHGLAGEAAAKSRKTSVGVIATDLIDKFSTAFSDLVSFK